MNSDLLKFADLYCRRLAGEHYENFAVTSPFVGRELRLDLMRFYAFCRTTDDLGDESATKQDALARLERWRDETQTVFAGSPPVHPVFIALRETIARKSLSSAPFLDLIAANVQDQTVSEYETWPQLLGYCMLSAAPVGRVVLDLFGTSSATAQKLSDDVCVGLQLANHAQDVRRDAAIGRRYLLGEDIEAGGIPFAVAALVQRARGLLASGRTLEAMTPGMLRRQLMLYRLGGLAICDAIEAMQFRTDVRRPHVSNGVKMAILLRVLAGLRDRHSGVHDAQTT